MSRKIFVNLPVKDLDESKRFFSSLGFDFNQQFSDEIAACVVISDDMYAHGFQDLDGHIWELAYMDPAAVNANG